MSSSDRDTLAALLHAEGAYCGACDFEGRCSDCDRILDTYAGAILRAGWRPPAREITDPAELPPGSVVIRDGVAYQREGDHWSMRGTKTRWDKPHGNGPIILLYVPTEEARDA
ncbi:hypothetical protein IU487_22190 [Nocardia puris]|uniref:hypothetical protein n=1 Tax=Nocardia puris TaxID=208602 RepID=UPI001896361B|nr:hypothetical protein [Nocardia puris]MBF6213730.1 hypothetical protein [Nocardia puris]